MRTQQLLFMDTCDVTVSKRRHICVQHGHSSLAVRRSQPTESSNARDMLCCWVCQQTPKKPTCTIDTIVNNCCVFCLQLNSPEQARVLIASELYSSFLWALATTRSEEHTSEL